MNFKKGFSCGALILAFLNFSSLVNNAISPDSEPSLLTSREKQTFDMTNPVAGMSREEAWKRAIELGSGRDCGSYRTMSSKEFMEWWASSNNEVLTELDYQKIGFVSMPNPVAGMSREEAWKRAIALGPGKNCGSYRTMSSKEFMEWWASSNNETLSEFEKFIFF